MSGGAYLLLNPLRSKRTPEPPRAGPPEPPWPRTRLGYIAWCLFVIVVMTITVLGVALLASWLAEFVPPGPVGDGTEVHHPPWMP